MDSSLTNDAQLAEIQSDLNNSMQSIQMAVMRLETLGPEFSDALASLREAHRLLFHLDLTLAALLKGTEEVTL